MFGIVYLITNLLDDKKYVGQTTCTLEERFYIKKLDCKHPHGTTLTAADVRGNQKLKLKSNSTRAKNFS